MRSTTYIAGITCISFSSLTVSAQQKTDVVKPARFTIGMQAGISNTFTHPDPFPYYRGNYGQGSAGSIGLFARYYIGNHFAVQSGADLSRTDETTISEPLYTSGTFSGNFTHSVRSASIDVPLIFQYNLLNKESKIRPYFGAGLTTRFNSTHMHYDYQDGLTEQTTITRHNTISGYGTITQGVTWQISNKWQFNESLNYLFSPRNNSLGLKLGLGYNIR